MNTAVRPFSPGWHSVVTMTATRATLFRALPCFDGSADPDELYQAFVDWAAGRGLTLYPHQEEALIELVSGSNVILSTPTGSGKSLVAMGAHFFLLANLIVDMLYAVLDPRIRYE
ncbi:MAG: hypothetical protein LOD91_02400 [Limnochordales bacterium]